jgi:hypothetical protein
MRVIAYGIRNMENLLTFLATLFYVALAVLFIVAIIEARQAEDRSAMEPTCREKGRKAA